MMGGEYNTWENCRGMDWFCISSCTQVWTPLLLQFPNVWDCIFTEEHRILWSIKWGNETKCTLFCFEKCIDSLFLSITTWKAILPMPRSVAARTIVALSFWPASYSHHVHLSRNYHVPLSRSYPDIRRALTLYFYRAPTLCLYHILTLYFVHVPTFYLFRAIDASPEQCRRGRQHQYLSWLRQEKRGVLFLHPPKKWSARVYCRQQKACRTGRLAMVSDYYLLYFYKVVVHYIIVKNIDSIVRQKKQFCRWKI